MQPTWPGTIGAKFPTARPASKSGTAVDTVRHGAGRARPPSRARPTFSACTRDGPSRLGRRRLGPGYDLAPTRPEEERTSLSGWRDGESALDPKKLIPAAPAFEGWRGRLLGVDHEQAASSGPGPTGPGGRCRRPDVSGRRSQPWPDPPNSTRNAWSLGAIANSPGMSWPSACEPQETDLRTEAGTGGRCTAHPWPPPRVRERTTDPLLGALAPGQVENVARRGDGGSRSPPSQRTLNWTQKLAAVERRPERRLELQPESRARWDRPPGTRSAPRPSSLSGGGGGGATTSVQVIRHRGAVRGAQGHWTIISPADQALAPYLRLPPTASGAAL